MTSSCIYFNSFPDEIRRQFENAGVKMIVTVPQLLEVALTVGTQIPGYKTTVCIGGEDDLAKNVQGLESLLKGNERVDNYVTIPKMCVF